MTLKTVRGTIQTLTDRSLSFPALVHDVATPGGCTACGIAVLNRTLPTLMKEVFEATATRNREVESEVHHLLTEKGFL